MGRGFFTGPEKEIDSILHQVGQTGETIPAPISAFLLTSKEKTILIDAGLGALTMLGPGLGNTLSSLRLLGVKSEHIDSVILTHAHPDHIGGMLTADNKKAFPNAEVIIAEAEATFWTDKGKMAQAPKKAQGAFQLAQKVLTTYGGQVTQVASGKEILPGITLDLAPGHTPGHSLLRFQHGAKECVMVADLLHNSEIHTAVPEAQFGFDIDSAQAIATRKKLLDQFASDQALIFGSHLPFPGFGRILTAKDNYRYSAASL